MKKHKKRISAQIDGKHIYEGKKIVQKILFAKRKKMRGNYCNSRSNVIKLTKIDGFIE